MLLVFEQHTEIYRAITFKDHFIAIWFCRDSTRREKIETNVEYVKLSAPLDSGLSKVVHSLVHINFCWLCECVKSVEKMNSDREMCVEIVKNKCDYRCI